MTERTHPNPNAAGEEMEQSTSDLNSTSQGALSRQSSTSSNKSRSGPWVPNSEWINSWKQKLPLQTIMRMLQV